jgi:hypothetical protein
MTECTHKRRAIQAIISKKANMITKMVEASGMKMSGASVVYILVAEI